MSTYQPRYLAYCKANNTTPEQDSQGGGVSFRFLVWMCARLDEFRSEHGLGRWDHIPSQQLDDWLEQRAEELARG